MNTKQLPTLQIPKSHCSWRQMLLENTPPAKRPKVRIPRKGMTKNN